jgi:hypothetical protein
VLFLAAVLVAIVSHLDNLAAGFAFGIRWDPDLDDTEPDHCRDDDGWEIRSASVSGGVVAGHCRAGV